MADLSSPFVSTEWLAAHLADATVQVIDGSWYLPTQNRNAAAEFAVAHVPGAIFLDIDTVAETASGLPHMLLPPERFGAVAGALGIASDATLVVYDGAGLFSAPRVRWMLRLYGARDVRILAGGMPKWRAEERQLASGAAAAPTAVFEVIPNPARVATLDDILTALADGSPQIVDARPAARFRGEAAEPRPGVRSGHMPSSFSVPATEVLAGDALPEPDTIRAVFTQAGVDLDRPIITSCGSGVTAAILTLALETIGKRDVRLYDGSWAEYGSRPDTVVEQGR